MTSTFQKLLAIRKKKGAGYLVLIDPDRKNAAILDDLVCGANESGVDALLVGGSLFMDGQFHQRMERIKALSRIPVILFPGASNQLTPHANAVLFMSVISGRNPAYLIGEQVVAAPIVKDLGLEAIPTAYMIFDGGGHTTVEFMSNSRPLPMERKDLAVAHGLAARYLGMSLLYLEAGSNAVRSIPEELVAEVKSAVGLPMMVGGGIRHPEEAHAKAMAGADFVVTGSAAENPAGVELMRAMARAIHGE